MRVTFGGQLTFEVSRSAPRARHRRERRANWQARTLVTGFASIFLVPVLVFVAGSVVVRWLGIT